MTGITETLVPAFVQYGALGLMAFIGIAFGFWGIRRGMTATVEMVKLTERMTNATVSIKEVVTALAEHEQLRHEQIRDVLTRLEIALSKDNRQ